MKLSRVPEHISGARLFTARITGNSFTEDKFDTYET